MEHTNTQHEHPGVQIQTLQTSAYSQFRDSLSVSKDTPGITLVRPMETFGDDDCPKGHMEILFEELGTSPVINNHQHVKRRTKLKRWQSPQATLRPSKLMLMLLACGFEYAKRIHASTWRHFWAWQNTLHRCHACDSCRMSGCQQTIWFGERQGAPAIFAWKHQLHPIALLQSPFKALKHHCKWLCLEKAFGCFCLQELDSKSNLEIRMSVWCRYL